MILRTLTLILAATALLAQSPKQVLPGDDWIQLFNGKDLSGWVEIGSEKWAVEDGVIHGQGLSDKYGYLQTEKTYVDFHMSIWYKCVGTGNSGLFVHTRFEPGTPRVTQGLQFDMDKRIGPWNGAIYGDGRGWIVWPAPEKGATLRPNDWNHMVVKVEGNRYVSYLNGVLMVDFTDPQPKSFDGYIALQLHSGGAGDMMFKDIYIRDLTKR